MKQIITYFLMAAFLLSLHGDAKAGAFTNRVEMSVDTTLCDGTLVHLEGTEHYMFQAQDNHNNSILIFNLQGHYIGFDEYGNEYIANVPFNSTIKYGKGEHMVIQDVALFNLVNLGTGENYQARFHVKLVINANGEVSLFTWLEEDICD